MGGGDGEGVVEGQWEGRWRGGGGRTVGGVMERGWWKDSGRGDGEVVY